MGEEIPDKEPTPKKCPHGRKNIYVKNVMGMEFVNIKSRGRFVKSVGAYKYVDITCIGQIVKSVELHKYVNIISRSIVVKSVRESIFNEKSISGLGNMRIAFTDIEMRILFAIRFR